MKKLLTILLTISLLYIPNKVVASEGKVYDNANVLTSEEIIEIENALQEVSSKHNIDAVFYTCDAYPMDNITRQAAEFFEANGHYDGFILELNLASMEYEIVVMGSSEYLRGYLEYGLDILYDALVDKDYILANKQFASFIDYAYEDYEYMQTHNNYPYEQPVRHEPMNITTKLVISMVVAGVVCLITLLILNKQLKTEGKKVNANNYVKPHSFNLTRSGDIYLYRSVSRTRRPRDNNRSSGGSSISHGGGHYTSGHTSSGRSYSGGGGRKL